MNHFKVLKYDTNILDFFDHVEINYISTLNMEIQQMTVK